MFSGRIRVVAILLLALSLGTAALGQTSGVTRTGVRGDVIGVDSSGAWIEIKGTDGAVAKVALINSTKYLGVEPGKTSLEGAVSLALGDVKPGDRVWARGTETLSDGTLVARQLVVMSASAIESRNQRDAAEWRQRGMFGEVRSVDAAARRITIENRRGMTVTVQAGPDTELRRLKPGAIDPTGAATIALADLAQGDQVAVRVLPGEDPANVSADRIFAGDFPRRAAGRVVSMDPAKGVVTVTGRDGQTSTILVSASTLTRHFAPPPPDQRPGGAGASAGQHGQGPGGPGRPGGSGPRGGGMMGFGVGPAERAELERRTQPFAIADLKPGDFVFAVSEPGAKAGPMPAAVFIKLTFPAGRRPTRAPDLGGWDILPGSGQN